MVFHSVFPLIQKGILLSIWTTLVTCYSRVFHPRWKRSCQCWRVTQCPETAPGASHQSPSAWMMCTRTMRPLQNDQEKTAHWPWLHMILCIRRWQERSQGWDDWREDWMSWSLCTSSLTFYEAFEWTYPATGSPNWWQSRRWGRTRWRGHSPWMRRSEGSAEMRPQTAPWLGCSRPSTTPVRSSGGSGRVPRSFPPTSRWAHRKPRWTHSVPEAHQGSKVHTVCSILVQCPLGYTNGSEPLHFLQSYWEKFFY